MACTRETISTHTLPWDILFLVVAVVPPSRLLPFLLACKAFRAVAEPLLYRHIDLLDHPKRSAYLFRTILNRSELGRHIITFSAAEKLPERPSRFNTLLHHLRGRQQAQPPSYRDVAQRVAQHLVNVKAVSYRGSSYTLLAGNHSITKFSVFSHHDPALHINYGVLLDALPHGVTHLHLPFELVAEPVVGVRLDHVPHLEMLLCSAHAAVELVPGRRIRELFIEFSYQLEGAPSIYDTMERLTHGSARIRTLRVSVQYMYLGDMMEVVDAIARFHPDLETLQLSLSFFLLEHSNHDLHTFLERVCRRDLLI